MTRDGHALGTLCVIDEHPRWLTPVQRRTLTALADQVVAVLELRRLNASLREALDARERAEADLHHQVTHDALTGLANRTLFFAELRDRLVAGETAVLYIDLDGFKDVNDSHGHHIGDDYLVSVAASLQSSVRSTDVIARLGGDEFAVITRLGSPGELSRLAARIRRSLRAPRLVGGRLMAADRLVVGQV